MVSKMAQREVGSQNYLLCKNTEAAPVKIEMPKPDWKKKNYPLKEKWLGNRWLKSNKVVRSGQILLNTELPE